MSRHQGTSGRNKPSGRQSDNGNGKSAGRQGGKASGSSYGRNNAPISSPWGKKSNNNEAKPVTGKPKTGSKAPKPAPLVEKDEIRLNRYIANSGACSRRDADIYIASGNVTVNGKVVTEMGHKVKRTDVVKFDGKVIIPEKKEYILLNKPKGFITTTSDEKDRKTVMDLVGKATKARIVPVGRLDRNTTGLLLFTNDGELAKKLTHPKHGIRKIYHVGLDKAIQHEDFKKIEKGLELEDGPISVDEISYIDGASKHEVGIKLHSGRNRIVRRIFEHLGYEVVMLDRVVFAGLTKKDLPRGTWRHLTEQEVINLRNL